MQLRYAAGFCATSSVHSAAIQTCCGISHTLGTITLPQNAHVPETRNPTPRCLYCATRKSRKLVLMAVEKRDTLPTNELPISGKAGRGLGGVVVLSNKWRVRSRAAAVSTSSSDCEHFPVGWVVTGGRHATHLRCMPVHWATNCDNFGRF